MRILRIKRYKEFADTPNPKAKLGHNGDGRTLGDAEFIEDDKVVFTCKSLEPAGPSTTEARKDRRIPEGLYNVIWQKSTTAGNKYVQDNELPLVYNDKVSKARAIRIHIGNYGKDTLGCILLGLSANDTKGTINNSTAAIKKMVEMWHPLAFKVEIVEIAKGDNND